jgi:8-oxo-dGTP diphosphatase
MSTLVVSAAIVERDGRVLVTRRQPGVHLEGLWEFPGGKCEAGETLDQCLRREMREELGVDVEVGAELFTVAHDYRDRRVELHFLRCAFEGDPVPQLGQELRWMTRDDLDPAAFPPADAELIRRLRRPAQ